MTKESPNGLSGRLGRRSFMQWAALSGASLSGIGAVSGEPVYWNAGGRLGLSLTDNTKSGSATFNHGYQPITIEAAGLDIWKETDEYAAAYESDVNHSTDAGDVIAQITIESQERTHEWAKAGLMAANDITGGGSSAGDVIIAATPENGFIMDWDDTGDGYLSEHMTDGSVSYPCKLRLRISGGDEQTARYVGEYSTNDGKSWSKLGEAKVESAQSVQDIGPFALSHDRDTKGRVKFSDFEIEQKTPAEQPVDDSTVDTTKSGNAAFSRVNGNYTIEAAGHDIWTDADEYAAIYDSMFYQSRDIVAETTIESQEETSEWAKAGIMVANDITKAGSSAGDIVVGATPGNGFFMDWDDTGDGYLSKHIADGSVSYPCKLRLEKKDGEFIGEYSTDGGESWTTIGTTTIDAADYTQDVGIFATSHDRDTKGKVEFADFELQQEDRTNHSVGPTPADTTRAGNASFSETPRESGNYTIEAAGHDIWTDADEYGALYGNGIVGDIVAETTIKSQEKTSEWAKAGLMVANDIMDGGSSAGDIVVGATPDHGFFMDWDDTGDGYVSKHIEDGSVSYPCKLRLEKKDTEFVGKYSTDDGETWTTLGSTTIDSADEAQDVGIFATSHDRDTKGTVEFTNFDIQTERVVQPSVNEPTVDTTESGNAIFDERVNASDGDDVLVIKAAGHDVWTDTDEYGAIYNEALTDDFVAETTILSQENTHEWAKAGIMIANDITASGSSAGDIVVAATPGHGFIMDWDDTGDGYLSKHIKNGSVSYPCNVRIKKKNLEFIGQYSTDGGETWTTLGTATIDSANETQDIGIFATSHDRENKGEVEFKNFSYGRNLSRKDSLGRPVIDTTPAGNANFDVSDGSITVEAAGKDIWTDVDEYGAVFEPGVDPDGAVATVIQTTIESQENTHGRAKAGIMTATDITNPGSSTGDCIIAATPEHGFIMAWDDTDDGYVSERIEDGSVSYPCKLRLTVTRSALTSNDIVGEYSTDGGDTWTTIGEAEAPGRNDAGLFVNSHQRGTTSKAEFSEFSIDETLADTVDTTPVINARFSGAYGQYIEAAGHDIWTDADEYGASYEEQSGDFVAETTIESQEATHDWAKAGIMVANDITASGSSAGDIIVAVTPEHGFIMDWDDTGDGFLSKHIQDGSTTYPCDLRLKKTGSKFVGEYSTDGGDTWTTLGTTTIDEANETQDVGRFVTSHDNENKSEVVFNSDPIV